MKMIAIIIFILMFSFPAFAPMERVIYLERPESINPYETIWHIVCQIESSNNPLAYHMEDNGFPSIGIAQIQQSRLSDFKRLTGINYLLTDMYVPENAKVVFMYYASEIRHSDYERICREWNGGPSGMNKKSTVNYYNLVKAKL